LEEAGVHLDTFTKRKSRSDTIILVKHIPHTTEESDLIELFGKFGDLGRVVLPPSRTIALVEFSHQNEAKAAFRKLAFSKFKHLPLYLEWAPVGTFTTPFDKLQAEKLKSQIMTINAPEPVKAKEAKADVMTKTIDDAQEDPDAMPVATVFVKNLNFSTTDAGLKSAFDGLEGLRSARVARKTDHKSGAKMSMGFGFLEFSTKEDAMTCIKTRQKYKLDGHELLLKYSNSTANASKTRKRDEEDIVITGTKLLIRNIPFEATKKDLRQLFTYINLT
jgi:multiple RNA-binding domain-containing protein 1